MGELLGVLFVLGIGYWLYKAGKQTGSRKGYHVGLHRGRRQRRGRR